MKAPLPLIRAMSGFLIGVLALLLPFVTIVTVAVLRAKTSHGTPAALDYRFGAIAIGLLVAGFGTGVMLVGRGDVPRLSLSSAAIGGAGAVTLLLVTMMLVGEPLGSVGAFVVAAATGLVAAWVVFRSAAVTPLIAS